MEGVTLCARVPLFVPKERKEAEYLQKLMKCGNNLCTSKNPKVCRLSLPIIILYFLFVLYNGQDEKQVILHGNSQRCHFIGRVAISLSFQSIEIILHLHKWEPGAAWFG